MNMTANVVELGRVQRLQDLVPIFREIRISLRINQRVVDEIAGMAEGLCGKIELGTRGLGAESCDKLLAALGLELAVVKRSECAVASLAAIPDKPRDAREVSKQRALVRQKIGGRNRWANVSAKRRKEAMRKVWEASAISRRKSAKLTRARERQAKKQKAGAAIESASAQLEKI